MVKASFPLNLLATLVLAARSQLEGEKPLQLVAHAVHFCIVLVLLALAHKTKRFNSYLGHLLLISFFLTTALLSDLENF